MSWCLKEPILRKHHPSQILGENYNPITPSYAQPHYNCEIQQEIGLSVIAATVRTVLDEHGKLPVAVAELGDDKDLFDVGLSSLTTVNVMLELEDAFEVEFSEEMLNRSTFRSVESISSAIEQLLAEAD